MDKKYAYAFSIAFIALILDQLAKFLIRKNFRLNESFPLIKDFLHLTYVTNTGSAFSLFQGFNLFFIVFSVIAIIAILYSIQKIKENEKWIQLSVGLLLGGTVGNLADRLALGSVVDFIDFRIWPVFNIADSAITVSVILLIILLWKK